MRGGAVSRAAAPGIPLAAGLRAIPAPDPVLPFPAAVATTAIPSGRRLMDLRKLRGKELVDMPGSTRRYHVPPPAARAISALLTLRGRVIAPILAGVRSLRMGRELAHWTRVDRDHESMCISTQELLREIVIETQAVAA